MILKHLADHFVKSSPTCGEIREILRGGECSPNVAIAIDIGVTIPHWHATFEEIYFVLDGSLELRTLDPAAADPAPQTILLGANELAVIPRGVHHQIIRASTPNRLAILTTPRFDPGDEVVSDRL